MINSKSLVFPASDNLQDPSKWLHSTQPGLMKPEYRLCPGGLVLTLSLGEVVSLGHHCFLQRKNPQGFSDLRSDSGDVCHGNKGQERNWGGLHFAG